MNDDQNHSSSTNEARDVYLRILNVADFFIAQSATLNLNMEALQAMNPDARKMAKIMRSLADVLRALAGNDYSDENMAINAFQCCLLMEQIADAIVQQDASLVEVLLSSLEKHVNAPIPL